MKTKPSARWIVRIRIITLGLAIALIAGIEFGVGESLASRIGQTTASRTGIPEAPSVGISDLIATTR